MKAKYSFATKLLRLLGSGFVEKKKKFGTKKTCLIISFGNYYRNTWSLGMILLCSSTIRISMFTDALILSNAN